MGKIVAIINQKGGVGKTTTAINLSCGLAMQGKKTLLIDLDPQAHSTIGIGIMPESFNIAINDVLLRKASIDDAILKTNVNTKLFLAPSRIQLDLAEQRLVPELFRETFLLKALEDLEYDFIIIDCRPTLGTLTINALYACNFIIVPCEMSRYALDGFADLLETINHVKNGDFSVHKSNSLRILLTKFDVRTKTTNEWVLNELKQFQSLIFQSIIRRNEAINQAHIAQEPIFIFKENSAGAEDYKKLTEEFIEICQK